MFAPLAEGRFGSSQPTWAGVVEFEPSEVDRHLVKTMARTGVPQSTIARCIGENGIDEKTLRRHFSRELEVAADIANAMIAGVP